jgi:hypothetical protein
MDGAVVFQSFFRPDIDLRGQSMLFGKDGGTDDGRVVGVNKCLSTDDHEDPSGLWVAGRTAHPIQLPSAQGSVHPRLKRQRIAHFGIELLSVLIDGRHVLRQALLPGSLLDKITQDSFYE